MRWDLVAARERAEVTRLSVTEKFAQLAQLMSFARVQGVQQAEAEIEAVRNRWKLLVERLLG